MSDQIIEWRFRADFDRDGDYEEDLTPYVSRPGNGIVISRGARPDGVYAVSRLQVGLRNTDGRFSDRNPSSPYYGRMAPGVPVQLVAEAGGVSYTVWTGYIASWSRSWATGEPPVVDVECWDLGHYMVESDFVHTTIGQEITTDQALNALLDAWQDRDGNPYIGEDLRLFDEGKQTLPIHFAIGQQVMEAAMSIARSEPGMLWITADGAVRFEARDSRLGLDDIDEVWGDETGIYPVVIEDETDDYDYVTSVRARASLFAKDQANIEIWRNTRGAKKSGASDSIALAPGESIKRAYQLPEAVEGITTPVPGTDYVANTQPDGSGQDRTAYLSMTVVPRGAGYIEITTRNTHLTDTIYVTYQRLRGQPVNFFYGDHPEAFVELGVPGRPAGKGLNIDKPFSGDSDPYQLVNDAMAMLRTYRYPVPRLKLTFIPKNADEQQSFLGLELGNLVRYRDIDPGPAGSYTDDWFYVEGLEYHIPPDWAGASFTVTVTLTPSYVFRNLDAIAWDDFNRSNTVSGLGKSSSGEDWSNDSEFRINSGAAVASSAATKCAIEVGASDQVAEVILNAIGADDEVGLCFRWLDADTQYRLYLNSATGQLVLERNIAGVQSVLESVAVTVGATHELRAMVQGSRIRAWLDHTLLIDTEDTGITTGTQAGLFARNAAGETTFHAFYAQGL